MKKEGVFIFSILLVGIFLIALGSTTYSSPPENFGGKTIEEGVCGSLSCTHYTSNYRSSYCFGYFGTFNGLHNDACACDSNRENKVTCCGSAGSDRPSSERGVYIREMNVYTYSGTDPDGGESYSITCALPCSPVNCQWGDWGECNSSGQQTRAAVVADSCGGTACTGPSVQSCTYLDRPYFANLVYPNTNISSAENGDTVLLRFPGANLQGQNITFEVQILQVDGWSNLWGLLNRNWDSFSRISGTAYETYRVTSEIKHRLNASSNNTNWKQSDNLSVNLLDNARPNANIVLPAGNLRWKVNNTIPFTQNSTDADDLLNIVWTFGEGSSASFTNYSWALTSDLANIGHNYSRFGVYSVNLNAMEILRQKSDDDYRTIFVFQEGINVMPVITSPQNLDIYGEGVVRFNISQSFVANCSDGIVVPFNFTTDDHLLNCSYLHAPGLKTTDSSKYNITVNVTFGDGQSVAGDWQKDYNKTVEFVHNYFTPGQHIAKIRIDYTY